MQDKDEDSVGDDIESLRGKPISTGTFFSFTKISMLKCSF